jgi:hypothetical protein
LVILNCGLNLGLREKKLMAVSFFAQYLHSNLMDHLTGNDFKALSLEKIVIV